MVSFEWIKLVFLGLFVIVVSAGLEFQPSAEFSRHTLIRPKIYHSREKRQISSTREDGLTHTDHLTLKVELKGKEEILDLKLNRDLLGGNFFVKYQGEDEGSVVEYPKPHEIELCQYKGYIRGIADSWAAVSTCEGIRGVIFDGSEMHYIENTITNGTKKLTDTHVVYRHSDLTKNLSCGFHDTPRFKREDEFSDVRSGRIKRDTSKVHGPYNANRLSRYIELVLVIDNKEFKALNEDTTKVYQHCKDIANIVNSLYVPLNIFVALVGVVIWSRNDEIVLETNGDKTLTNFLLYRKERLLKDHPNDNAQLLTRLQFSEGVVGKALKGPICTFEFSGGVNVDHSNTVGLVASTVAHEMGHNLGMEHDTTECTCPSERCIMSPSSSSTSPTEWSSCSIEYLTVAFEHGMDYCLRNKPTSLFDGPVCGNGFVEPGEQCDCGLKEKCNNPCCNMSTCMLHANASCATGECCDLQTCKPHTAGTVCRTADHECDLPEYCTGQSEYCPDDVFKVDGEPCNKGTAFCYNGNCRSHSDQCRILWGPSGQSSDMQCYKQNMKGNRSGNCGYNRLNQSYIKCKEENVYCGMLQCKHFNEKLEFGMESVAILSHSFISIDNSVIPCRTAIVDLGLNEVDPGLAPDGAKCGENKMCLNQKCMEIDSLRAISTPGACPHNCNDNGVCNSKGHCHCKDGFAPPYCEYAGVGGSVDSGPAANPYTYHSFMTVFSYLMLALIPVLMILLMYSYHIRKSPSYFWKRNQRRTVHCEKSITIQVSRNNNVGGNTNSTVQSLLPNNSKPDDVPGGPNLKDTLIGNFKGFSITPISSSAPTPAPIRPAPTAPSKNLVTRPALPSHPVPVAAVKPMRMAPKMPPTPEEAKKTPPLLPPPNTACVARPLISSPVLDDTTSSTVRELIQKETPVRPAPPVPVPKSRPSSTPGILEVDAKELENSVKPCGKEQSLTLNRIASFISKSQHKEDKRDGGTLKAAKIDRNTLKNLKISDPIPLNEINIPVNPLPLSREQEKNVVMRAQSLRQNGKKERPSIHSFGSVRIPASRRPTSIPSCSRPTSPPPCPPAAQNGSRNLHGYSQEQDSEDNIYAVIEENPAEESKISPLKNPILGTGDGLLNEIVNEIQARNIDSIYSSDTKKRGEDSVSSRSNLSSISSPDGNQLYENTSSLADPEYPKSSSSSTASSGYMTPIKSHSGSKPVVVNSSSKIKVPEKSAPGYKPFSGAKKQITPIVASLHSKKFSPESSKSSQDKAPLNGVKKVDGKSAVSSTVSKFNANDEKSKVGKPNITKPKPTGGLAKASVKGETRPKAASVASIQQKFEAQSKQATKNDKGSFMK